MKRLFALLLTIILAVSFAGCGNKDEKKGTGEPAAKAPETEADQGQKDGEADQEEEKDNTEKGKGSYRVLLSNAFYTAPYCAAYNPAAEKKAKELGIKLTILDANANQQTALEHANIALNDGYDGFIYFPADVDGALPVIEALNDSGIIWVGANAYDGDKIGEVGMKYYVGPDSKSHGVTMAKYLKEEFPDGGNFVSVEGPAGAAQTAKINEAFSENLDKTYQFLDKQDCNYQPELAMTKVTDMLTAYGVKSQGGKIDCIISHDGGMLTGIISALEAAGLKPGDVKIVACGSNQVIYDALQSGWLSATSTQDPYMEGAYVIEVIYGLLTGNGDVKEGWTKLETPLATKENADDFKWF